MLQIRLLGQCDVRLDGKRVLIPSWAGQSLFAYLALTSGTAHRREKLAGTFWPDTSDDHARKHLRQELWRIRKAIAAHQYCGGGWGWRGAGWRGRTSTGRHEQCNCNHLRKQWQPSHLVCEVYSCIHCDVPVAVQSQLSCHFPKIVM
jgi:hypothetical protein